MSFRTTQRVAIAALTVSVWSASSLMVFAQTPDPATVKHGQQVYAAQKCMVCHSIAGTGNKTNPLDGVGLKLTAAEIREWIVSPIETAKKLKSTRKPPMMDRYSKLPAADIDGLVGYMQSLNKKP